ncbi:MAG: DNA-binding transcriptional MerR regulator [Candidatus Aldehydirespiratoraceae bacterium]|jgi:DNA-binding transcriptional MerR regulator
MSNDELSPASSEEYGLAELAEISEVSERTIRYYQNEKLLPKPEKKGRDAVYNGGHRERLAVITELRDRGLTLHNIRDLVASKLPTRTVSEWLGVDATLSAPWSDDRPATVSHDELVVMISADGDAPKGVIGELSDAGYVEAQSGRIWLIPSPALLDHALRLRAAGIDIEVSALIRDLLRRRLSRVVADTVKLLVERAGAGFAGSASPEELATALGALRPVARETSSVILAQEVELALAGLMQGEIGSKKSRR